MSDAVLPTPPRIRSPGEPLTWSPRAWLPLIWLPLARLPSTRLSWRPAGSPVSGGDRRRPEVADLPRWGIAVRTAVATGTLVLALGLLAIVAAALARLHGGLAEPTLSPSPPPEWIDVPRPVHIFDLESPLLRGLPASYSARRRPAGDGREDVLAYGALGLDAPALRLRLRRQGSEAAASAPLFAAIALQAAETGLSIERAGLADVMPTRFGPFEIADVTLTDGSVARVPCSGFRLALASPAFTISGLACGLPGRPVTRTTLACLVDRLDLASGGDDRAMIDVFAASERRRDPACAGARLAPDGMHAAWLDDKPVTHSRTSRHH